MPSMTIRVAHASGRYDADPHEVAAYIAENIRRLRLDLVTTTESQQRGIGGIVRETVGERFGVAKKGEYLCIWRRSLFSRRPRQSPRMLHVSHILGLIAWRQMRAAVFPIQLHGPGIPVDAVSSHAPSAVQSGARWSDNRRQVSASQRGHRRLGRWILRRRAARPRLVILVGEDSNLDHHLRTWREWLRTNLHAPSIWATEQPARGSHGHRLIDVISATSGPLVKVTVLDSGVSPIHRPIGYDHALVWAELRISWETA